MKNKHLFTFITAIIIVFSVCTALPVKISVPLETSASGMDNIAARADYLYNTTWTAQATVKGWRNNYTFAQGNTYHIPYGQPVTKGKYICWGVSVNDFLSATQNASSIFYTSRSVYNSKESTYYSMDCSALASYCWDLPNRTTTAGWANLDVTNYGKCTSANVNKIQKGDALNYYDGPNANNHVVIVSDAIYDSNGNIYQIEITEQTPPETKRSYYTASSLVSKYSNYTIYRYNKRNSVTPPPSLPDNKKWYDDMTPVNIGDSFYGKIKSQYVDWYFTNNNGNVEGQEAKDDNSQIWKFERLGDGSYKIISQSNGESLNVYDGASGGEGSNITTWWGGGNPQQFWFYEIYGALYIRAKCSDLVLDMDLNNYPANVAVYGYGGDWTPMKFEVEKIELNVQLQGNLNDDGEINISDVVILQKWLLAEPDIELTNWKAADLYEDNRIDVFDMIEMRKLIVKK